MPIYEYSCEKCGDTVERIQKFSDPLLTEHEECGGPLTKLISQSSFHLKGDGWYVTDYARKDKTEDADGDKKESKKPDAAESEGTKETGTSDKPATSDKAEKTETSSKTTKRESSTPKSDKSKPTGGSG